MSCATPVDSARLTDYWLALVPEAEEHVVEEHLFSCGECAARLGEVAAIAAGIRRLAQEGSLRMVVSEAFVRRATEEGLQVRQYALPAGGSVECTVTASDDLLIARLAADLQGAKRVDLCICDGAGAEQVRLADIPVHSGAGGVLYQESITYAKAAPSNRMIARLVAVEEGAAERLLGEYTFNHTRTLPGPGAFPEPPLAES